MCICSKASRSGNYFSPTFDCIFSAENLFSFNEIDFANSRPEKWFN